MIAAERGSWVSPSHSAGAEKQQLRSQTLPTSGPKAEGKERQGQFPAWMLSTAQDPEHLCAVDILNTPSKIMPTCLP